jgi:hypothetical protein
MMEKPGLPSLLLLSAVAAAAAFLGRAALA